VPSACDSDCSLREAVLAANAGSGNDTIILPAGHFQLGIAGVGEDAAAAGDLDLTKSVTISGAGARSTVVDAVGLDRVFDVGSGAVVLISDLTVTGGAGPAGAGMRNAGTLTLVRDALTGNQAAGTNNGGGILSNGSLTITRSTIAGNHGHDGGGIAFGGQLSVMDSTVAGNVAGIPGAGGEAGAILGATGSTLTIASSTITGNQAFAGVTTTAGIASPGSVTVENSIVAGNVAHESDQSAAAVLNCATPVSSSGHNLSDTADCGFTHAADHAGVPVLLGPLGNNGGATDTEALLPGSPARDGGANCPATDERGVSRPRGAACDIGAYEVAPPLATTSTASGVTFGAATLKGTVDPSARETTAVFQYGATTSYGSTLDLGVVGSGIGPVAVSAGLTGLRQGVTYHYRLVATNAEGTTAGADQAFTTLDKVKPVLSLLRVLPGLFHRNKGATLSFRLSEPGTVTFRVDRVLRGVRRHGSCVVRKRRSRGRPCTRYVPVPGSFAEAGTDGPNSFHFDARVGGRLLFPGAYRLRASPRDNAGNVGKTVIAAFRVLR
jgi:hypothetical protein